MVFQVAQVKKALGSVPNIVRNGDMVVFDEDGSYIMNKDSGKKMWMRGDNGVFVLDVLVAPASWKKPDKPADFRRSQ